MSNQVKKILLILFFSILMTALFWTMDAIIDKKYYFHEMTFAELLYEKVPVHELYMRTIVGVGFFLIGTFYYIFSEKNIKDIREREERLETAVEDIKKSNEELEQFAYIASHDLQEPLRAVSAYCQLLKEKEYNNVDEEGKKYFDYIVDSSMRMKTLIKELLDYSRVGRRDKPFEKINLQELLQEVLYDFEISLKESEAEIIIESQLPQIIAIRFRMKQLLHNLISNSLKFKSDKKPVIRIGCCEDDGYMNHWLFYIKDNGIGIESRYYDRIFGVFKRLYSREEYPGTGIGLALCKKIVEAHGGEIWVESEKGEGTYVYFTISKSWNVF